MVHSMNRCSCSYIILCVEKVFEDLTKGRGHICIKVGRVDTLIVSQIPISHFLLIYMGICMVLYSFSYNYT